MKLILEYLKRYRFWFVLNIISVFGFALVELGIPTIISYMIDRGVMNQDRKFLLKMGGLTAGISVIGVCGTILLGYCCARISTGIAHDIRKDVFRKVQTFSHSEMNEIGVASLITRTNNDAFQIMMFMNVILRTAVLTPVMIAVSFMLTVRTSLRLSLIIISTVPLIIIGVIVVAKISSPISERQQTSLDSMNRIFRENLTGIRVIRSFNNDEYESERFDSENVNFMRQSQKLFKLMSSTDPVFLLMMNAAIIAIYIVASFLINTGSLPVGKLIAFMDYVFHAMFSVLLFCLVFMMYPRANVSAKRIRRVLDTESIIINHPASGKREDEKKSIVFEDVTFAYPDGEEAVLQHISFEAGQGETVAIIGSTGSGKSTLIKLIPRFYDVSSGRILINGVDVRDMDLYQLRDRIGFVSQKANLFSGTIEENIRFGNREASMEEVVHAAKVAQAYDFIMEKPGKFQERIVEGAGNVSGGQRQRLSIARALVRHADFYIYDDSFSALDFQTDARLRSELRKELRNEIVLIVAQRVSTIMDADQIIVLDEGKIVGRGTHRELLKHCSVYYEIAASQLSEEELTYE